MCVNTVVRYFDYILNASYSILKYLANIKIGLHSMTMHHLLNWPYGQKRSAKY